MEILLISLLTFVSGIIGTITGFGISTVMVPFVLLFLPLPETLLLVGIIHWFGDLWKILLFKHGIDKKLLLYFGIPGIIAALIGGTLVVNFPEDFATRIVGSVLILYVIYIIIKPNFKVKQNAPFAILGGGFSGLLGGLTGVGGGALRAIVLTAFNIPKSTYIFTSGVLGALIDAGRITAYLATGVKIQNALLTGFVIFVPISFLGAEIAKKVVDKIPQKSFRLVVALFLLFLGVKLLIFT